MSATSELAALRAFAVATLPLVENYKAKRCSYISEHHVAQVDAAIDAMNAWTASTVEAPKPLKFDVLDLIREPDNFTSGERAQASTWLSELIEAANAVSESCVKHYGAAMSLHLDVAGSGGKNERLQAALARIEGAA